MRLYTSRVSAFVGTVVAFLAAFVLASPHDIDENGRDRDTSAIRFTRAGLRLDTGDVVAHHGDESYPLPAVAADDLNASGSQTTFVGSPGGLAIVTSAPTPVGPDETVSRALTLLVSSRSLALPHRPALGRAPPFA
jgi:hypothetical protein